MSAITTGFQSGIQDWRSGPAIPKLDATQARYLERWLFFTGELFSDMARTNPYRSDPRVYRNISLLWKHYEAVVTFYASVIYQGDLSTDGRQLPDGTRGAIPIDPQTGSDATNTQLMTAIAELWSAWNWRQQMSLRPMYGAALGDVMTELVDDVERGMVYPRIVWPGYVVDLELDYVGNVKAYALEYRVTEEHRNGQSETYTYRKEVDGDEFRYFKNGDPFDYFGVGAVIANPYGFVPAVWDRHRITWGDRGASATDGTRQALLQLNSIFAHAFDFQRKAFFAPIIVSGKLTKSMQDTVQMAAPASGKDASVLARQLQFLESDNDNVTIEQAQFDIGKTLEMIEFLRKGIQAENPEASFYQQLREMTQVTAPGAERLMGDVKSRVDLARAGYDAQTVKLFQMALSMCGMRANDGWTRPLTRRQAVFLPYTLDTYKAGGMDFGISSRPLILPTEAERIDLIAAKEALVTRYGLAAAGLDEAEIASVLKDRQENLAVIGDYGTAEGI